MLQDELEDLKAKAATGDREALCRLAELIQEALLTVRLVATAVVSEATELTQADFDALIARLREAPNDDEAKARILEIMSSGVVLDFSQMKVQQRFKLEKFEGEWEPGKKPFEVIEGGDDIPTTTRRM